MTQNAILFIAAITIAIGLTAFYFGSYYGTSYGYKKGIEACDCQHVVVKCNQAIEYRDSLIDLMYHSAIRVDSVLTRIKNTQQHVIRELTQ